MGETKEYWQYIIFVMLFLNLMVNMSLLVWNNIPPNNPYRNRAYLIPILLFIISYIGAAIYDQTLFVLPKTCLISILSTFIWILIEGNLYRFIKK